PQALRRFAPRARTSRSQAHCRRGCVAFLPSTKKNQVRIRRGTWWRLEIPWYCLAFGSVSPTLTRLEHAPRARGTRCRRGCVTFLFVTEKNQVPIYIRRQLYLRWNSTRIYSSSLFLSRNK